MPGPSNVFDRHYKDYLNQLKTLDLASVSPVAGGVFLPERNGVAIPYFGRRYLVSPLGIEGPDGNRPGYEACIILSRYLIMAQDRPLSPQRDAAPVEWTGFRDLKDSGPLTVYFSANTEQAIAGALTGRAENAHEKLSALGGLPPDLDAAWDLALEIPGLPRVPLLLLFNDAEEGFPAACSVLFPSDVETWVDAECIAMMGYALAEQVRECMGESAV